MLEVEDGRACSPLPLGVSLILQVGTLCMGALGGLYRPTPRGTIVIRPGVGPGCQSLWWPASPPAAWAHRLVGPADLSGTEPTGRLRRSRVLSATDHCSREANDAGSVRGAWLQRRRLAGVYCSHTASYLVDGAWGPEEGTGRLLEAGLPRVRLARLPPSFGLSQMGGARRPWAVPTGRRGSRAPPAFGDVRGGVATVPRRAEISAGTVHCGHAYPRIWEGWAVL